MATYRIHKTKDYTVMSNTHFREKEMTLKAKGLLSLMLSLPDDWDYSIAGLVTLSKDGKDSVMNALNELESFGYLKRTKLFNEKGQFDGYDYDVYETPNTELPKTEKPYAENPNTEKPNAENPNTEKPNADNPTQYNTKQSNTEKINTKESNNNYIVEIIDYLNQKAGTNFRTKSEATKKLINARLNEGFTVDDFKTVIDKKTQEWKGSDMEQYLRPQTLFGTKFESYLNCKSNVRKFEKKSNEPETINGKQYTKIGGKYYLMGGNGVAVDPFAQDDDLYF